MGLDFGKLLADAAKGVSDAAKGVSDFIVKTGDDITRAVDQNGDGKLDISDIQVALERARAAQEERRRQADLERLKPLFLQDTEQSGFALPKLICVAPMDKAHAESPLCSGSVGFWTVQEQISALTAFQDQMGCFGLTFYPAAEMGVYYVDPCDSRHYILLDEYFAYLKVQRVAELQRIAQALGAKHFRIVFRENFKSNASASVATSEGVKAGKDKVDASVRHTVKNDETSAMRVEAEMTFPGRDPVRPELRYLRNEPNILNLIELRMDPHSPLQHQHFSIEMKNSSGISVSDAVKIDAMLKAMRATSSTTVESQARSESCRELEDVIDF